MSVQEQVGTWLARKTIWVPPDVTDIDINLQAINLATLYIDYTLIGTGSFQSPGIFTTIAVTEGPHIFTVQVDTYGGIPSQLYLQVTDTYGGTLLEQAQGNGSWQTTGYINTPYAISYDQDWESSTYIPFSYFYAIAGAFSNASVEYKITDTGSPVVRELVGYGVSPWNWNAGGYYT